MADWKSGIVDVIKYPVAIFSILLALIIAQHTLGIRFAGNVAEVGLNGVKFSEDAKGDIADLDSKLNGALDAIDQLKKQKGASAEFSEGANFLATQTVSDQTAQLAKLASNPDAGQGRLSGAIWIGNYDADGGWTKPELLGPDGKPVDVPPVSLTTNAEYVVRNNLVVRDGVPSDTPDYYRARKSLGVVPKNTKVLLLEPPVAIKRQSAVHYWAEVQLP